MVTGKLYRFNYLQGTDSETMVARVIRVRDTYKEPLFWETIKKNPNILRSRFLFTVRKIDGTLRNCYEHAIFAPQKVGLIGRIALWLRGVRV